MRQVRRGVSPLAYGLLIVVLALLPLIAASCGGRRQEEADHQHDPKPWHDDHQAGHVDDPGHDHYREVAPIRPS
jgi:hypothetical protein